MENNRRRDYGYLFGNKDWIADDGLYISIPLAKQIAGDYVKRLLNCFIPCLKWKQSQLDYLCRDGRND
jgi:hypothetical protein